MMLTALLMGVLSTDWQLAEMAWPACLPREVQMVGVDELNEAADFIGAAGLEEWVPRGEDGDGREIRTKERPGYSLLAKS